MTLPDKVAKIDAARAQPPQPTGDVGALEKELSELYDISAAIGITEFMDLPDGGAVSLAEQVRRMRAALRSAEHDTSHHVCGLTKT